MNDQDEDGSKSRSRSLRKLALASLGVALGVIFFWLALQHVEWKEAEAILKEQDPTYLLLAVLVYWTGIVLRILRWQRMLVRHHRATFSQIAETLIVGYAVNYVLPARLGELFRADYARRRFNMPRSLVFGSIVIERLTDGVIVVCLLWLGLTWLMHSSNFGTEQLWAIEVVAQIGAATFAAGLLCVFLLLHYRVRLALGPKWVRVRIAAFVDGLATLGSAWTWRVLSLSVAIWMTELIALWLVFKSLSIELTLAATLTLAGAATLSSLVPTAPGFVGSYQLVFVMGMKAVGDSSAVGLAAATAIQVAFFGTVTLAGLAIFISRQLSGAAGAFVHKEPMRIAAEEQPKEH